MTASTLRWLPVAYFTSQASKTKGCEFGSHWATAATLPVIGGINNTGAQVLYSGQAPGIVSGVAQFNLVIPQDALAGNVPISVKIGDAYSQSGVTVAVK